MFMNPPKNTFIVYLDYNGAGRTAGGSEKLSLFPKKEYLTGPVPENKRNICL